MSRTSARIYDEYLAASARAGDRGAFGRLAARWHPKLLAHAFRLIGEGEAARDIAQEAWADIAKGLGRLDDVRVFPAWAYRIVSRRAADVIRKRKRERRGLDAYTAEPRVTEEGTRLVEANADVSPLRAAMSVLPAGQRAALALFYLEEFSVAEVAVALSIPAGTVKTRLMHGRQKLRRVLEGEAKNG